MYCVCAYACVITLNMLVIGKPRAKPFGVLLHTLVAVSSQLVDDAHAATAALYAYGLIRELNTLDEVVMNYESKHRVTMIFTHEPKPNK